MTDKIQLSDNEKRDIMKYIEKNKPLPDKYRFLLFGDDREIELIWNGKTDKVESSVLPFQTIEHIDEPRSKEIKGRQYDMLDVFDSLGRQQAGWTNKLIWGDSKLILSSLKNGLMRKEIEAQGGLKLIYIDPPFDVGADFSMKVEVGENNEEFTKKPSIIEEVAYRDTWGKGADSFISMIYERLRLMYDLLADDGSVYVHCDYRVSGYLRLLLDEIFGKKNFRNEIIWKYSGGASSKKFFARKHDVIFFYSKSEKYNFNQQFEEFAEATLARFNKIDEEGRRYKENKMADGRVYNTYMNEDGKPATDIFDFNIVVSSHDEAVKYPTQKPEAMLERIIKASSNEGDLVADFFSGSGTTLAVAEKLGRKWIGADLGRFGIHTARKRMIGVQRELKESGKDFRAFEILNLGKYERNAFLASDVRSEQKEALQKKKEKEFVSLILQSYKAESIESFESFQGKKRDRLIAIGSLTDPVSRSFVDECIKEAKEKNITKIDILGFEFGMGIDVDIVSGEGVDVRLRIIPGEVFDKRAIERGHVKFFDLAYVDFKTIIKGRGKEKELQVELTDFATFYNQDDVSMIEEKMKKGSSKIILENGQIFKISKDKRTDIISREQVTNNWTDWIDYWSVDFDFESKKEIIRVPKEQTVQQKLDGSSDAIQGELIDFEEKWTGGYIFENEWQSFRTKKDRSLELISAPKKVKKGQRLKVAVKVIDIFGNDTTKVIEVNI